MCQNGKLHTQSGWLLLNPAHRLGFGGSCSCCIKVQIQIRSFIAKKNEQPNHQFVTRQDHLLFHYWYLQLFLLLRFGMNLSMTWPQNVICTMGSIRGHLKLCLGSWWVISFPEAGVKRWCLQCMKKDLNFFKKSLGNLLYKMWSISIRTCAIKRKQ